MNQSKTPYWIFYLYWLSMPILGICGYKFKIEAFIYLALAMACFAMGLMLAFVSLQKTYKGEEDDDTTMDLIWRVVIKRKKFIE